MRAEYRCPEIRADAEDGSPPHAWGIQHACHQVRNLLRFTPTCVGNTTAVQYREGPEAVHPHMRGEYIAWSFRHAFNVGSPPHAWGIHQVGRRCTGFLRFTPTCVGNTLPHELSHQPSPVHPHMRGEYPIGFRWSRTGTGSPPTCVGNTIFRT